MTATTFDQSVSIIVLSSVKIVLKKHLAYARGVLFRIVIL